MKRLVLMRHGQAQSGGGVPDRDRPLTQEGQREAQWAGAVLAAEGWLPDRVVASPAVRSRDTAKHARSAVEEIPVAGLETDLYAATAGDILEIIRRLPAHAGNVLVVGHNPGIHQLAVVMAGRGEKEMLGRLQRGYPPASLTVLEAAELQEWSALEPGMMRLVAFLMPPGSNEYLG